MLNKIMKFNKEQTEKYANCEIKDTGHLAYRDIKKFCAFHEVDLSKVLDLGYGAGRSTNFLSALCGYVSGTDISKEMLAIASGQYKFNFYLNNHQQKTHPMSPYSAIFSIFMFFHFSTEEMMQKELTKCFGSLNQSGHLIIVNGTRNLYTKKFISVQGLGPPPSNDGDLCEVYLKNVDCKIQDFYWSENCIINNAVKSGFTFIGSHCPLGQQKDNQPYQDEYAFPPYYYLAFIKYE